MANSKKTFWPYGIVLSIIACVIACVATIIISLDYPVYMDDRYMQKYQSVDHNINEIKSSQREFERKFSVKLLQNELKLNEPNSIKIAVTNLENGLDKPKFTMFLTRPDSSKYDIDLNASYENDILKTQNFTPNLVGRWQLVLKLQDKNSTGFYKFELFSGE
ncbi:FixH family protein [Campylobacter gastrosuis]|uniref:FixH family protein n=1 Tax=Campylobacter gastrosuis TaxID=2974576 RepID=A0ABT7HPL1_9BACT|nr:FixH family protein [Campylobacter gastrosuis]MDL0088846.1 FixH family protein [Campylobacter gastrosuis]